MKRKTFFLAALALCSLANAQIGINTTTPTNTLDVNGLVRVRGLSNPDNKIVAADSQGVLTLISPEEIFAPKALLNTSMSSTEQRFTVYEGKCFQPGDNASSCTVSLNHYTSCAGFSNPVATEVVVGQGINTSNGQFLGSWTARYIDNKGFSNTSAVANQTAPDYPRISYPVANSANYLGSGNFNGQCNTDLVTTINQTTGDIKIESVKRNMFAHLIYLLSVARSRSL
ncbi:MULTISPECIES: hypothetical protein [Chryseobacterium]|uniref:T9SS C-terminal target domain-containing protein n=1 Tax=Chryseobacterium bernardetii TaxID=1241978 RepID=A0A3G6U1E1_9FLAO|nr:MULTISPECIES: hypothetical protein [Chryseobacterium]AZB26263.1 hypothetical protein EG339_17535 [Chryseobacterium bernardetii]AZB32766.1 hypothetical protein EG351_03415 [Chryseobacterium bernardetii]UCA60530.1 hypothetical protein KB553_03140 [Chryseobacterium rhizoplanae]